MSLPRTGQFELRSASCREEEVPRKGSSTAWTPIQLNILCTFEQFKPILEAPLLILHCQTMYSCQTTPSSTSSMLGTLTSYTLSSSEAWFWEVRVPRKRGKRCSSQPSTQSWSSMEDSVVPHVRHLYSHPLAGLPCERQFEKVLLKFPIWECLLVNLKKGPFLSVYVDNIKIGWQENKTLTQCGKYSWKTLIWASQHHSLTMLIWFALQETAKRPKILWTIIEICLNVGFLQELLKSYLVHGNWRRTSLHGPVIWKVMQRIVWSDIAS